MGWLGAGIDGPLVAVRAIHLAASAVVAGSLIFRAVVARSTLRSAEPVAAVVRIQTLRTASIGLAVAAASGVIWVLLQAAAMSGQSFGDAMTAEVLSTVITETQFGLICEIRLVLAVILAGCLTCDHVALLRWLGLGSALGLIAAIAWTGHAWSSAGELGILHLTADMLHLVAAAAWIGGLVSLALLLAAAVRGGHAWTPLARDAAKLFSNLGIISVGTLFSTGFVNAWILVGSFNALIVTEYGKLLTLKAGLFVIMLAFAVVNRFWLTPRLAFSSANEAQLDAVRRLTRNSVIEIALGFTIFVIVGMLGTLHPAIHGL